MLTAYLYNTQTQKLRLLERAELLDSAPFGTRSGTQKPGER